MKPARIHYVLARGFALATSTGAVAFAIFVAGNLLLTSTQPVSPSFIIWFTCATLLGLPLGWVLGAMFVWPPVFWFAGWINGFPFVVGDKVRILVGPNRDRVVQVYEVWGERRELRVDLGAQAKTDVTDVYPFHQICRERDSE